MEETVEILVFKTEVYIRRKGKFWLMGFRRYPLKIFSPVNDDDFSRLVLAPTLTLESGARLIEGEKGLHRCIRPKDPNDKKCYFIPNDFLLPSVSRP